MTCLRMARISMVFPGEEHYLFMLGRIVSSSSGILVVSFLSEDPGSSERVEVPFKENQLTILNLEKTPAKWR